SVPSEPADHVRVASVVPPVFVADYDSAEHRQTQFLVSLPISGWFHSCDVNSRTSFGTVLSSRQGALFASQPNAQRAPCSNDWHSNETDRVQAQAHDVERFIRPGADYIAETITECIDYAFRFVFIFAPQNGKQNFARRTKQRKAG